MFHPGAPSNLLSKIRLWSEFDNDDMLLKILLTKSFCRSSQWIHTRIDWCYHVDKKIHEDMFVKTYRMSFDAFKDLMLLLSPYLVRDYSKSRTLEPVPMHTIVAIGLQYLTGSKYQDLCDVHCVSSTEVYNCVDCFLDAVLLCESISINLPSTPNEWEQVRQSFASKSYSRLFNHCVGAIDGFFQPTIVPSKSETCGNQRAYFSGHYKSPGLNCQAICDGQIQFLYFGVVAPGQTNDNIAYFNTGLDDHLKQVLKFPLHLVRFCLLRK